MINSVYKKIKQFIVGVLFFCEVSRTMSNFAALNGVLRTFLQAEIAQDNLEHRLSLLTVNSIVSLIESC